MLFLFIKKRQKATKKLVSRQLPPRKIAPDYSQDLGYGQDQGWGGGNFLWGHLSQNLKNYQLISLLPIWSQVVERFLYNSVFEFFIQDNLITRNQSSFMVANLCINQLISLTYKIYKSFNDDRDVLGVLCKFRTLLPKAPLLTIYK